MKHFIIKLTTYVVLFSNLIGSTLTVCAAESTDFPSVPYKDPFLWTEEKASDYPCTDEGDFYLPTEKIDNTANFYFYIEDNNSSIMSNQVYANTLVWRPLESEGIPILNTSVTHMPLAATQPLMIKLNPYNLKKLETLEHGSIYYIQYGIPNGYFTANGSASVNTGGYVNILTPDFQISENYIDVYRPTKQEEAAHQWLKADNNDLTFYALYGSKDWLDAYWNEFRNWGTEHQGTSANETQTSLDAEETVTNLNTEELTQQSAEATIEISQIEKSEIVTNQKINITAGMIIAIIVVTCAALTLLILKIREKQK